MQGHRPRRGWRTVALYSAAFAFGAFVMGDAAAFRGDRKVVFVCPCSAEFAPEADGKGTLTLQFGMRNLRDTGSAEVGVYVDAYWTDRDGRDWQQDLHDDHQQEMSLGSLDPGSSATGLSRSFRVRRPDEPGANLLVRLWEAKGRTSGNLDSPARWLGPVHSESYFQVHEDLTLWPVPGDGLSGRVRYVDLLTDSDGDGAGDVNEGIAGTDPNDAASSPGASTVDVLWLYQASLWSPDLLAEYHHGAAVANSFFVDSRTNVQLRSVGFVAVKGDEFDEHGRVKGERLDELMDRHGADLAMLLYDGEDDIPDWCGGAAGCAEYGDFRQRGFYQSARSVIRWAWPDVIAHELGHVMGLAHSARQGEAEGSFRWSRGHYIRGWKGGAGAAGNRGNFLVPDPGTIMSYGFDLSAPTFSSPASERCEPWGRCGVAAESPNGADAVRSLDLIRFQVAGQRGSKPDSDGDGFVDAADRFADDPARWTDWDGDGLGDGEDPDVDGDGWANPDDLFPLDPEEWADLDGDGSGDNADPDADGDGVANSDDAFPLNALDWQDADGDGVGDNTQALHPFRDANLRAIVERRLGKSAGAPISEGDMARLTELEDPDADVGDLTGLELAEGLTKLVLNVRSLGWKGAGQRGVSDLSPLSGLDGLRTVWLSADPRLSDLSPLSSLSELNSLVLVGGDVSQWDPAGQNRMRVSSVTALAGLPLSELALVNGLIADLGPVSQMQGLRRLNLTQNRIRDASALSSLPDLERLNLYFNGVEDVSPLASLSQLQDLQIGGNEIEDLSPLAGLRQLRQLAINGNRIVDVSPLAGLSELSDLNLGGNHISDLGPLSGMPELWGLGVGLNPLPTDNPLAHFAPGPRLTYLELDELGIADLSFLAAFMDRFGPRRWFLHLSGNPISDLGPLARRSLWDLGYSEQEILPAINLQWVASLDQDSLERHIPQLRSWGVEVHYAPAPVIHTVAVPDKRLRTLVVEATCGGDVNVDDPLETWRMADLDAVHAFNRGVFSLAGLEHAENLRELHAGSNGVSDLTPLSGLPLAVLDLRDNLVSDLSPLAGSDSLETLQLDGNPLTQESLNTHIPALRDAGARVEVETVEWTVAAGGAEATFDMSGYFGSLLGAGTSLSAASTDPSLASVDMTGGELALTPGAAEGRAIVTVKATNGAGESATLKFDVAVANPREVPLFPSAAEASREGFLRAINRSGEVGMVCISAIDGAGVPAPSVTLAMAAEASSHFNSGDLENGNPAKRLTGSAGSGAGDWRLSLLSRLDISAPAYIRTADGFVTAMHDVVPEADGEHRVATFNPASNYRQFSRLRLINPGGEDASVTIQGVDDRGASPGGLVRAIVRAGSELVLNSDDLESGAGLDGALGDGTGKWRLSVASEQPLKVMSLMESPTGHLTNLSTVPAADGGRHLVPLFPSASDPLGRQGFIRVINNGGSAAQISITAFDDSEWAYDPLTLAVPANEVRHVNSDDLELGNADKGLSGRTGAGQGHWRLELSGPDDIDVLAYIRTKDGFLTSMHDLVPGVDNRHEVAFLNPGSNNRQVSRLRLINAGDEPAQVRITGIDGVGASPGDTVRVSLKAGAMRSFTAAELESGAAGLKGALGDGASKWHLLVESDWPITVMSLLETPTGHLTNLSSTPKPPGGS